jgi:PAS domain S-box-containing protein
MDQDAKILKTSDAAFSVLGYTREDLVETSLWNYIVPEDVEDTKHFFEQIQEKKVLYGKDKSFVNHLIGKNGNPVRLVWRFSVCDEREWRIIGIASDVSEFGTNDKYNFKLLEKAVKLSTDGIAVIDAADQTFPLIYVNESFEEINGFSKDEILGQNCWFNQTEDNERSRAVDTLIHALLSKKKCDVLLQCQKRNGEIFYGHFIVSPVTEMKDVVNFIVVLRDVTEEVGVRYDWSPNSQNGFTIKAPKQNEF